MQCVSDNGFFSSVAFSFSFVFVGAPLIFLGLGGHPCPDDICTTHEECGEAYCSSTEGCSHCVWCHAEGDSVTGACTDASTATTS